MAKRKPTEIETLKELVNQAYALLGPLRRGNGFSSINGDSTGVKPWVDAVDEFFSDDLVHQTCEGGPAPPLGGVPLWCEAINGVQYPKLKFTDDHRKTTCVACLAAHQAFLHEEIKANTDLVFEVKTRQSQVESESFKSKRRK